MPSELEEPVDVDGYVVEDDFFGKPYIDVDEERTDPLPHRFVHGGFEGTDTSSCVERFTDLEVRTFRGEQRNLKVTYADDIAVAERLLTRTQRPATGWR